jgi:hypothetical protein
VGYLDTLKASASILELPLNPHIVTLPMDRI